MKERPILFQGAMVRAILDGSKTQTRRVLRHQPMARHQLYSVTHGGSMVIAAKWIPNTGDDGPNAVLCPYGFPGDRLWVRESLTARRSADGRLVDYAYAADGAKVPRLAALADWASDGMAFTHLARPSGVPSIHMPRWACRLVLDVVAVRVERLQVISEADAQAEGWVRDAERSSDPEVHADAARDWYADLWVAINGAGSWQANPWVWVVEFKRVQP